MKKTILIGVGLVVMGAGVFFVGYKRTQKTEKAEPGLRRGTTPSTGSGQAEHTEVDHHVLQVETARLSERGATESAKPVESVDKALSEYSDAVQLLLDPDADFKQMYAATRVLPLDLSEADIAVLIEFLKRPNAEFGDMRPIVLNSIKNDVLERLIDQRTLPEGIDQQLLEMYEASEDPMWQEYALQFMAPVYDRLARPVGSVNGAVPVSEERQERIQVIQQTLETALEDRGSMVAGTALLGLEELSRNHDEISGEEISDKAVEIAADRTALMSSRLTALRVAAMTGNEDTLVVARNMIEESSSPLLRSAAVATLGDLGSVEDLDLLTILADSGNRQVSAAAKMAIDKLGRRQ